MKFDEIREYWENRARADGSAQATTNDVYLREIEYRTINGALYKVAPKSVLDIGCGDGRTTIRLAQSHPNCRFVGLDYASSMVDIARGLVADAAIPNLSVRMGDVTESLHKESADFVYTTRCLINLPSFEVQASALTNIVSALRPGGHYLMVENFIEGHDRFNAVRRDFGLSEIPVRTHNTFFERDKVANLLSGHGRIVREENISSIYYLVSRVVYAKICKDHGLDPSYFDVHHALGAQLPFVGEFGPVRAVLFQKD